MRTSALFAAAVCAAAAAAASAHIRLPFTRQPAPPYGRSSSSFSSHLPITSNAYLVNVTVGTPPQRQTLKLSVQAGESYVIDAAQCSGYGSYSDDVACAYGSFDGNASSTYVNPGSESFSASRDAGYGSGEVMSETLDVGGVRLPKITLGLADTADSNVGVLGLGFNASAYASSSSYGTNSLPTVPDRLLQDGEIGSTAYSVWFDDEVAQSGTVLLGAVDKSAFEGPLIRFPISSEYSSSTTDFQTILFSVNGSKSVTDAFTPLGNQTASSSSYAYSRSRTVRLSPDVVASYLPDDIARDIYALVGAVSDTSNYQAIVPCSANTSTARLALQLHGADGPVLAVAVADLVVPSALYREEQWSWATESSEEYCLFAVLSDDSYAMNRYTLGSGVLKNAYLVFDLANEEVAVAKTKFGGSAATEEIVAFSSYAAKIPESTSVKSAVCSSGSASYYSGCSGSGSGSGDDDDDDNDGSGSRSGGGYSGDYGGGGYGGGPGDFVVSVSKATQIGLGVGISAFVLIVGALTAWAVMRCRRIRKAEAELGAKQADVEGGETRVGTGDASGQAASVTPAVVVHEPTTGTAGGQVNAQGDGPSRQQ
ncbi:putative aspartic-type endopeptidase OPSB [Colletotrichum orbiculare MAFF 240422]|uniref:Aspartic-type endopeptidase OPSB n=1 Tax=Colletotrichum orbiculare (strain 104-T / ATCC 96160 / CBS 514.97 / LARS 414 / MAFF 240422) TaxID=1213857 RepID=N4VCC1_COLOR|nr:putative aspartic-type endopeptidase OPSB [Colletotrichum orbiculare MAFF 240422]